MKYLLTSAVFFLSSLSIFSQWIPQNSGTDKEFYNLHFLNDNLGWVCGDDGTILKTTNGGDNWILQNANTIDAVRDIFFIDSLNGWAITREFFPRHSSIIHTTNSGESWEVQLSIDDYALLSIHFINDLKGWVAGSNGKVYHTTNAGSTWQEQFPPTQGGWLWPIFFIDDSIGWAAGDPNFGVFKTTDGGNSWQSHNITFFDMIYSMIFIDQNTGWVSGPQGQISKSIDGGINWENLQSGTSEFLRDIFFIDINNGWCVGENGTILYTINGGLDWVTQLSNTNSVLHSVQFVDNSVGWAVGYNGTILKTLNAGIPVELISFTGELINNSVKLSWITATETNNSGFEIQRRFESSDWQIIAFIEGKGTTTEVQNYFFTDNLKEFSSNYVVYRLKQLDFNGSFEFTEEIQIELNLPNSFSLSQNYPNPFNPLTKIKYQTPELNFVTLKVFDLLGNEVAELVNEEKAAGSYELTWYAENLTSGIYFYWIQAGDFIETKKMILLK